MIDEDIERAIFEELQTYLQNNWPGAMAMYATDYARKREFTHPGTWVLLSIVPNGGEQYCGNLTRWEYTLRFDSYNYMPDPMGSEIDTHLAMDQVGFMRAIRQHFVMRQWQSIASMTIPMCITQYGLRWALSEVQPAQDIDMDGLSIGRAIILNANAVDVTTSDVVLSPRAKTSGGKFTNPSIQISAT